MGCLFWAMGLFNFSGSDSAAKVLVAVLALIGTVFGTTVTLVGLMLKRSMDARTVVLQTQAEARLNLDTAIKAVELFKSASDGASSAESAGALFALTRLGQTHFALSLLEELWPKNQIGSPSAIWVINNCLQSTDVGVAKRAADVLLANAIKLPDDRGGKYWPADYDLEWPGEMSFFARHYMLQARIDALLSKPFEYWQRAQINVDIVALSNCFRKDSSSDIRQSAAAFLGILLEIYDPRGKTVLTLPTEKLAIEVLRAEIVTRYGSSLSAANNQDLELEEELRGWVKRAAYFETSRPAVENSSGE
jgi:hypothetical protein